MHADLHPAISRCSRAVTRQLDFGASPRRSGIPRRLAARRYRARRGRAYAVQLARQAGAPRPDAEVDPRLIIERLHPPRGHWPTPASRTQPAARAHNPPPSRASPSVAHPDSAAGYALVWRATPGPGLFAQLGATVPTRGFHLAYSPGFRGSIPRHSPSQPAAHSATPAEQQPLPKHEQMPQAADSGADPSGAALTSEYRIAG
jgi:hypothetical protein